MNKIHTRTAALLAFALASAPAFAQEAAAESAQAETAPANATQEAPRRLSWRERLTGQSQPKRDHVAEAEAEYASGAEVSPGDPATLSRTERNKLTMEIYHCRHPEVRAEMNASQHNQYANLSINDKSNIEVNRRGNAAAGGGMPDRCTALIAKWDRALNPQRYQAR